MFWKKFAIFCLTKLVIVIANFPPIPCPQNFQYDWDGRRYYGKVTINDFHSQQVIMEVKLTQNRPIDKGNFGQIVFDQEKSNFQDGCFVYRVDFPFQDEFPAVKSIIVNGTIICQATSPEVIGARQTISLFHSLRYNVPKWTDDAFGGNNFANNIFLRESHQNVQQVYQRTVTIQRTTSPLPNMQQAAFRPIESQSTYNRPNNSEQPNNGYERRTPFTQPKPQTQMVNIERPTTQAPYIQRAPSGQAEVPTGVVRTHSLQYSTSTTPKPNGNSSNGLVCNFIQKASETSNDLPKNTKFPWVAGIFRKGIIGLNFTCDGSLISAHTVVTSAECLDSNGVSSENAVVFLGWNPLEYTNESEVVIREAERIIVHPDFYKNGTDNEDIALMHLKKPINFTQNIHPICLWSDFKSNKKPNDR